MSIKNTITQPPIRKMNFTEEFVFYEPYVVNNYIEDYMKSIPDVELLRMSIAPTPPDEDETTTTTPETEITEKKQPYTMNIDTYFILFQYKWMIESVEYLLNIHIKESHERDKYSPVDSSGYFITNCKIQVEPSSNTKYVDVVYRNIDYINGSLKQIELIENKRYMILNTQLSYAENRQESADHISSSRNLSNFI